MKNDRLSDALRRGDPAVGQPQTRTAHERKNALLARCAAEPFTEPTLSPTAAKNALPRKMRWALPTLAGALTAAAIYGAMAWFGASDHTSQAVPTQIVQSSPRPSTATPAPRDTAQVLAPTPRAVSADSAIVQAMNPKRKKTRRDTNVADLAPTVRATNPVVSVRPLRQINAISPVPAKAIVRTNRKANDNGPRLIAVVPKLQAVPRETVEPVVSRVIIEQDDTPTEPAQTVTSVAIVLNGRSESVIVSRAAEPATN